MSDMYGVVNGCYICPDDKLNNMNKEIFERNIPSQALRPQYDIRPVSTKYSLMPIVDQFKSPRVDCHSYKHYSTKDVFNPGNAQAPWNGFAENINVESTLRNQFFALQKCDQAYYVPSTKSDLYNTTVVSKKVAQEHELLFEDPEFDPFNPNQHKLSQRMFNNPTRYDIRGLEC